MDLFLALPVHVEGLFGRLPTRARIRRQERVRADPLMGRDGRRVLLAGCRELFAELPGHRERLLFLLLPQWSAVGHLHAKVAVKITNTCGANG